MNTTHIVQKVLWYLSMEYPSIPLNLARDVLENANALEEASVPAIAGVVVRTLKGEYEQ